MRPRGKMKILTIVGARPQFIKAAPVSRALNKQHTEVLVHTGQHYDDNMSGVFFRELGIPAPDYNLEVGSGGHGEQTGLMLQRLEPLVIQERPDLLLVYGDTNSTLAGALTAAKLHIPLAHVEAGLRSFDRRMPEEINRVVADQLGNLLFCPTRTAVDNLKREGIGSLPQLEQRIYEVGDVMYDAVLHNLALAEANSAALLATMGVRPQGYTLATVHRAANTDDPDRLRSIVAAFARIGSAEQPLIFPLHPRTGKMMAALGIEMGAGVKLIEPVGYLEMLNLERNARLIITDSGGVQKEAYFLAVPCLTLRAETEWVETVASGWNRLVGSDTDKIIAAAQFAAPTSAPPSLFGDGHASERIATLISAMS
jgi:UDP-GlcNAc3NAcA epimerase